MFFCPCSSVLDGLEKVCRIESLQALLSLHLPPLGLALPLQDVHDLVLGEGQLVREREREMKGGLDNNYSWARAVLLDFLYIEKKVIFCLSGFLFWHVPEI